MPKNLSFAMVVVLMSLIPVYAGAQAVFDASKVTDAKAKAAVEKINELQAKIKELKIDEMTSVIQVKIRDAATSIVMKTTVMERRPDLFYKSEKTVGGPMNGNKNGILLDGKNMWRIDVAGDAHVKMMIENMQKQKMPQDQIDKMVAGMRMRVTRCDLQRIRDAGAWDKFELMNKGTLNPLSVISPASLKIDHETPSEWVFTSTVSDIKAPVTLTYGKTNGMCLKLESRSPDGSVAVITLDKFAINPTPPIQDAYFKYTPSPNVTVTDGTDGMIQMFKRMTAMGR